MKRHTKMYCKLYRYSGNPRNTSINVGFMGKKSCSIFYHLLPFCQQKTQWLITICQHFRLWILPIHSEPTDKSEEITYILLNNYLLFLFHSDNLHYWHGIFLWYRITLCIWIRHYEYLPFGWSYCGMCWFKLSSNQNYGQQRLRYLA